MLARSLRALACAVLTCLVGGGAVAQEDGHASGSELKLWQFADDEAERLESSGLLVQDAELVAYVEAVAASVAPEPVPFPRPLRFAVLDDPEANAFAMPNGRIYVHLGLLTTLRSEDELAAVLAHEIAHVTERHGVEGYDQARGTSAALQILSVGIAAGFGVAGGANAGLWNGLSQMGLGLAASAAVSGHGRGRETEADETSVAALHARGRDACGARNAFASMLELYDDPSAAATFFYGSHPRLTSRRDRMAGLAEETSGTPCEAAASDSLYLERMNAWRAPVARAWLKAGQSGRAKWVAQEGLALDPDDASLHAALAEAYAAENEQSQAAEDHFRTAIELDSTSAHAHRGLAELLDGGGRPKKAIAHYEAYLKHARRPRDRRYVRTRIGSLREQLAAPPDSVGAAGAQPSSPSSQPDTAP